MSSVCPSVTLMDQDHISWKSWKLITRTIRSTSSLFVAQRPSTYSHGNMGKFWGREKWRTEAQKLQYLWKRLKIDEKLLWRAYSNAPTLLQTVPCSTPTASPSPRTHSRSQPQPKIAIAVMSGMGKATNFKFLAGTFTGSIRTKAH